MNDTTTQQKIRSFTDLNAWKEGHVLVLYVYNITLCFPKEERFGLTSQLRRAAVSVTSNVAEGFSRGSYKEKVQFYRTSLGSLTEVQNQLLIARDVQYITAKESAEGFRMTTTVSKLLNGLIKSSLQRVASSSHNP